jgi:hypothetical protein
MKIIMIDVKTGIMTETEVDDFIEEEMQPQAPTIEEKYLEMKEALDIILGVKDNEL